MKNQIKLLHIMLITSKNSRYMFMRFLDVAINFICVKREELKHPTQFLKYSSLNNNCSIIKSGLKPKMSKTRHSTPAIHVRISSRNKFTNNISKTNVFGETLIS